jgi:hypothetical protein
LKFYDSMDEMFTDLDDTPERSRFRARFPRLAHWLSDPDTLCGLALGLWGSAIAEIAAGVVPRHTLWFLAAPLLVVSAYRFVVTAVHCATCPLVLKRAPWDETPEDAPEEVE